MAVTEAGSAAEVVVQVDVEMSRLAPVAPLALHVLFTETISRLSVTAGSVAQTSLHHTLAGLTAPAGSVREVPVVGLALVALVSRHPGLTLTLSLTGTLEVGGAGGVAVTGQTGLAALGVLHWRDVVVVLAQLAVGSTPVAPAVLTLSASPALHVKFLVKPTLSGPVVTLAGWIEKLFSKKKLKSSVVLRRQGLAFSEVALCHLRSQWSRRQVSQLSPVVPCLHRQILRLFGSFGSLGIQTLEWPLHLHRPPTWK